MGKFEINKVEVIFATHNKHKVQEAQLICGETSNIKITSLHKLGHNKEIIEDGLTLEENAILKAKEIFKLYQKPTFSEDTGLEIFGLNNEPGVKTARYAGDKRNPNANMQLVLDNLKSNPNRNCQFRTIIAYIDASVLRLFEGKIKGTIAHTLIGENGFGYDPIFIPDGFDQTFGQLDESIKANISHRKKAFNLFLAYLQTKGI